MRKRKLRLWSTLSFLAAFSACHTPMPKGPVCLMYPEPDGTMYCAYVGDPEEAEVFPISEREGAYVCRPDWYEQAMIEWIKRELERKRRR